jgi:crotonobetainyl-CoA:carnitine CoA-transferase CaiB-like acyl-CoA transferase
MLCSHGSCCTAGRPLSTHCRPLVRVMSAAADGPERASATPGRGAGLAAALPRCRPVETHPSPKLGQHNREIYGGWLGLSAAEIAETQRDGVI